jgi:Na+/phosphate symporter
MPTNNGSRNEIDSLIHENENLKKTIKKLKEEKENALRDLADSVRSELCYQETIRNLKLKMHEKNDTTRA